MPARIVIALDNSDLADREAVALRTAGHDAIMFHDSMTALKALEDSDRVEVLAVSLEQETGKPNGVSLALLAKARYPNIKAVLLDCLARQQ